VIDQAKQEAQSKISTNMEQKSAEIRKGNNKTNVGSD